MIILGLEGTAHTFGAALIDEKGNVLSDVRSIYKTQHTGIVPQDAAKHHENVKNEIVNKAFEEANLKPKDIDLISFSNSPGIAPCLLVVMKKAKELAIKYNKPLIPVNHSVAHLTSGLLFTKAKDPVYIYVAGANTQIIALQDNYFRILGESLDVGLGNALDKFARSIGLGFPGGPEIEKLALTGNYVDLPYSVKGMDLTFSGLTTAAINKAKNNNKNDLCYSLQETIFAMLIEVSERALAFTDKKEALLIGGVAANKRLIDMLEKMCTARKAKFHYVPLKYSGDNAVMIAWQGLLEYNPRNKLDINKIDIEPYKRSDQVFVDWF